MAISLVRYSTAQSVPSDGRSKVSCRNVSHSLDVMIATPGSWRALLLFVIGTKDKKSPDQWAYCNSTNPTAVFIATIPHSFHLRHLHLYPAFPPELSFLTRAILKFLLRKASVSSSKQSNQSTHVVHQASFHNTPTTPSVRQHSSRLHTTHTIAHSCSQVDKHPIAYSDSFVCPRKYAFAHDANHSAVRTR